MYGSAHIGASLQILLAKPLQASCRCALSKKQSVKPLLFHLIGNSLIQLSPILNLCICEKRILD